MSSECSQWFDLVFEDPTTTFENIAYTLHFYTAHNQEWLKERATSTLISVIPLFVTGWGSIAYRIIKTNGWIGAI